MPSNNSIRCGEMQLRRRRLQTAKREFGNNSRELTPNEVCIYHLIILYSVFLLRLRSLNAFLPQFLLIL